MPSIASSRPQRRPVLLEAGEESIALAADNFVLEDRGPNASCYRPGTIAVTWSGALPGIDSESRGRWNYASNVRLRSPGRYVVDLARGARDQIELHGVAAGVP